MANQNMDAVVIRHNSSSVYIDTTYFLSHGKTSIIHRGFYDIQPHTCAHFTPPARQDKTAVVYTSPSHRCTTHEVSKL